MHEWKFEPKTTAMTRSGSNLDLRSMRFNNAPRKGQPDSRSAEGSIGFSVELVEWLEGVINLGFRHARTLVFDRDDCMITDHFQADRNRPNVIGKLDRVVDKLVDHPCDLVLIRVYVDHVLAGIEADL